MNEEKMKVLEMLEKGTITTEEALALLKQIPERGRDESDESGEGIINGHDVRDDARGPRHEHRHDRHRHGGPRGEINLDWIDNLRDSLQYFGMGKREESVSLETQTISQIRTLKLHVKNERVDVVGYEGDKILMTVTYIPRDGYDPRISLEQNGDDVELSYNSNGVHSIGAVVKVPRVPVARLDIENANARVQVRKVTAREMELSTKNAPVEIEDASADEIKVETKNAGISFSDISAADIEAKTTNAKITLDDVTVGRARVETSNAKIDTTDINADKIIAKTSNAGLFVNYANGAFREEKMFSLEAQTSNAGLRVTLPRDGIESRLKASTSNGRIENEAFEVTYGTVEKTYVDARSNGFEQAARKLSLNLQSSNGSITIKKA